MSSKPFSPEEVQQILESLQQPAVFLDMTADWPVRRWTAEYLSHRLGPKTVRFRLGRRQDTHAPLFETQCSYVEASLGQFCCWVAGQTGSAVGPLCDYPLLDYWAYADYKYIAVLLHDQPAMFKDVRWCEWGYPGRDGRESTLWLGTEGANTPCHQDAYGWNLVLQVQGRKRWRLFPPEDGRRLYPSRIPYEESSVFSRVDVLRPDLRRFPAFAQTSPRVVTLQPGQVLFVPRHWWHYVESLDPLTVSVNYWAELEADDEARVGEAVTKTVVCALKTTPSADNHDNWLNPTEVEVASHTENLRFLSLALQACLERRARSQGHDQRTSPPPGAPGARAAKRDASGQTRSGGDSSTSFAIPFGPHLIPVPIVLDVEEHSPRDHETKPSSGVPALQPHPDGGARHGAEHGSAPHHRGSPGGDGGAEEDSEEAAGHAHINTNDLLECLVHPDVIARVTELLLERQSRHHNTTS